MDHPIVVKLAEHYPVSIREARAKLRTICQLEASGFAEDRICEYVCFEIKRQRTLAYQAGEVRRRFDELLHALGFYRVLDWLNKMLNFDK